MELPQLQLQINGFCVIEDVIPADRCAQVRDSVLATVERVGLNSPAPEGVGFVSSVINHDQSFAPYLADDCWAIICESLSRRRLSTVPATRAAAGMPTGPSIRTMPATSPRPIQIK